MAMEVSSTPIPDVVLLDGNAMLGVDGGMKDVILQVGKRAHSVKKQLAAVLALDRDQPVAAHVARGDLHLGRAVLG